MTIDEQKKAAAEAALEYVSKLPAGAVIGVGLAKGVSHLDLSSIGRIVLSWVVTIPAGATLTVLFYVLLRFMTGV